MSVLVYAFLGEKLIAQGLTEDVEGQIKNLIDRQNILVFDQLNGSQIHLDFSQLRPDSEAQVEPAKEESSKSKRGRPKLGVVGREITLLPRHWKWLDSQRGGASATLRRLVDQQRSASAGHDRVREAQDSTNRFIYALAGNLNNFEEAVRALYGKNETTFVESIGDWPNDIRKCAMQYAAEVWA